MVLVIMGVSGAGKTTIGQSLARAAGWRFVDADDLHSPANVAKMARGEALTDADRGPWLRAVAAVMRDALARGQTLVVACSALKRAYRETLAGGDRRVVFVYLRAPHEALAARLASRTDHFAKADLLESQLATLEEPGPDDAIIVDAARPPEVIVDAVRERLASRDGMQEG
jgi:carbohydrate kinase (thermoresistant glucokinase family)